MLTPLVSLTQFKEWLGEEDVDVARAKLAIEIASETVRDEAGRTWVTEGELDEVPGVVVGITIRLAERLWRNPSGVSQQSAGPFTTSYAKYLLSDDDKRILQKFNGTSGGLFTIKTTRAEIETDSVYLEVQGSDKPIPAGPPW